jgi:hypothetical protein
MAGSTSSRMPYTVECISLCGTRKKAIPRTGCGNGSSRRSLSSSEKNAGENQIKDLISILKNDKYRKLTGGRFSNAAPPMIVDEKPIGSDREGKTVISFAPGIVFGGIAHSEDWDRDGLIHYAEITYDTNQKILPTFVWHEMAHTVSAGGHINKWPSVVSEVECNGTIFAMDEKIFNCIYNSPPLRSN